MTMRSWSVFDLLAVAIIGLLLSSLAAMNVVRVRQHARGENCDDNLKQLGLAIHNYHAAYKRLPMGAGGTDNGDENNPTAGNGGRLSPFVGLTPFMEQQAVWEQIANPLEHGGVTYPSMGPLPGLDPKLYPPWGKRPWNLVCPSDPDSQRFPLASSYVINYGDGVLQVGASAGDQFGRRANALMVLRRATQRGVFRRQGALRFRDILDGLSNTLMVSEAQLGGKPVSRSVEDLAIDPSQTIEAFGGPDFWPDGRGARWCDGTLFSSGFQAILPPNSPSATSDLGEQTAVMSASSYHGDGAHVVMCDGAVLFVTESIDAGDPASPSVAMDAFRKVKDGRKFAPPGSRSPYGVWGGMGSRASKEVVNVRDNEAVTPPRRSVPPDTMLEIKKTPIRTWTAANGRSKMKGWLVSCKADGRIQLLGDDDRIKYLKLSQLSSEDAYFIVESLVERKREAQKVLLTQMKEAVSLLEKKEFADFVTKFVDAGELNLGEMAQLSNAIYLQRGLMIYAFDNAVSGLEKGNNPQFQMDDSGQMVAFGGRGGAEIVMRFRNGRWKIQSGNARRAARAMRAPALMAEEAEYEVMMEEALEN